MVSNFGEMDLNPTAFYIATGSLSVKPAVNPSARKEVQMEDKNRREKITISVPAWLAVLIRKEAEKAGITVSDLFKDLILKKFFQEL